MKVLIIAGFLTALLILLFSQRILKCDSQTQSLNPMKNVEKLHDENYRRYPNNYYDEGGWMREVFPFIGPFATRDQIPPQVATSHPLLKEDMCKECMNQCKLRRWELDYSLNSSWTEIYCKKQCDKICESL